MSGTNMDLYFERPCQVIDFLPSQVPPEDGERFFAVERLYLSGKRCRELRERFADVILKLYCYDRLTVYENGEETGAADPAPGGLSDSIIRARKDLAFHLPGQDALITLGRDDTHMTVYGASEQLLCRIRLLAASNGLFVWQPQGQ